MTSFHVMIHFHTLPNNFGMSCFCFVILLLFHDLVKKIMWPVYHFYSRLLYWQCDNFMIVLVSMQLLWKLWIKSIGIWLQQHAVNLESYECFFGYTVRCRYDEVNLIPNPRKLHPIARPLGRCIGCILWVQTVIYTLLQSPQWCMQYHVILDRVVTALDCTVSSYQPYMMYNISFD